MTVDFKTSRSDLLLAPRQLGVLFAPYTASIVNTLEDAATGNLSIPETFEVMGLHEKKTGGSLSNAQDINDIESHGHGTPTRQLPTKRTVQLGIAPQESTKGNIERYWGADWSSVNASAHGGFVGGVPELPLTTKLRCLLIGEDDFEGDPIYLYWIGNKVQINKTSDQKLTDAEVLTYPYTVNFMADDVNKMPILVGICGPGWEALQDLTDAGFSGS